MKRAMLYLVFLAVTFVANAQTLYTMTGDPVVVEVKKNKIEEIKTRLVIDSSGTIPEFYIDLEGVPVGDGVTMNLYGVWIDSIFRPKMAWVKAPGLQVPNDGFSYEGSLLVNCTDEFISDLNVLLYKLRQKGTNWEIKTKKDFVDPSGGPYSTYTLNQENGLFTCNPLASRDELTQK
jgi:hypothetical protein